MRMQLDPKRVAVAFLFALAFFINRDGLPLKAVAPHEGVAGAYCDTPKRVVAIVHDITEPGAPPFEQFEAYCVVKSGYFLHLYDVRTLLRVDSMGYNFSVEGDEFTHDHIMLPAAQTKVYER